jgi:hypothetical protein
MAYIGPAPNPGQNREVDDISSGFNGSEVNFTLQVNSQNVSPGSSNAIVVSLGGVVQNPGTDYTVAASTLTFTTAPASGLSFFGLVLGQGIDTTQVADDSVTNAKVSGSAAIAGTKISPDFGSQNVVTTGTLGSGALSVNTGTGNTCATFTSTDAGAVVNITDNSARSSIEQNGTDLKIISDTDAGDADSTIKFQVDSSTKMTLNHNGKLLLGHSTARAIAGNTDRTIQIEATDAAASLSITRNSANAGGPFLSLGKSRSASVGGSTVVNSGDTLGTISFAGADGTDVITRGADIIGEVDGTPGANDMPGRLRFSTTPDGGSSPVERMRISQNGNVTMPHQACMVFTNPTDVTDPSENTPLQFSGLDVSKGGMAESNTRSRITVPTTGTYLISALISGSIVTASSTDGVEFHLRKNGSVFPSSATFPITTYGQNQGDEYYIDYTVILNLTANDYLEVALTNIDASQADVQRGYFAVALIS